MRIGLYLDVRNPPGWGRTSASVYAWNLELAEQADVLGIDSLWTTEHHLFDDGYLPQPLTFAAAVAARTRSSRVGTAVLLAPLRPAIQIAEEAAVVDLISGGRLDLGLGAGYRVREFRAYGADPADRFAVLDRRVEEVRALLGGGTVTPAPVQSPLPLWLGYLGPAGARRAGRLGEGLLSLVPETVQPYREGLAEGGHPAHAGRMAGLVYALVADDPEEAWRGAGAHVAGQLHSYARHAAEGTGIPVSPPPTGEDVRVAGRRSESPGVFPAFVVLTPEEAVDLLRRRAPAGIRSEAFFWAAIAGMPEDLVLRHLELLCTKVKPAVRDL